MIAFEALWIKERKERPLACDNAEKKRTTTPHGASRQRTIRKRILWGVILFVCSFVVSGIGIRAAQGQTVMRVGVLPFRIYAVNPERIAEWSKKVVPLISAELAKDERLVLIPESKIQEALEKAGHREIDEQVAREIGRAADADLMIVGSLTQINGAISLDVRAVDVYQPGILASGFAEGKKMEDFPAMVTQVSREIRVRALKEEMVTQILVEGNRAIEASAIRLVLKMKEGDVLTPRGLREDVNSIYQLGYFQDVRAEKREWGRGKAIVFIVEEKPVIREIKFSGNKKIKSGDLQEVIDLKPRSILNINAVKENQNKILKKYKEEAYFAAEVEYELETPRKGDVIVHYKINENKKIPIRKITFAGNLHFSDAQLKSLLPETKEKDWLSWIRKTGIYKEDVLERDLDAVLGFYYQNGFLDAKAGKPTVTIDAKGMSIQIPVEEGRQFKVGKVDIQGDLIAPQEELFKLVSLYVGEILNRDRIRDSVMRLTDRYADRGYAFVDVNPQTIVHPEKDLVDIVFEIQQGNKVYFDRINITGNHKTRDKVIRRELKIQEGELYSLSGVKKSRDNLNYVGYFKEANITTKKGGRRGQVGCGREGRGSPHGRLQPWGGIQLHR